MAEEEKKRKQAIAIQYNPDEVAHKILASGTGIIADKIIEKAKSSDVPLYEDDKLANTLSKLDIGEYIPPELYSIVAEILVFVDNLDKIKGKIHDRK
uniref:EscU/YscU/HrcU family type III secretion system export apparatus switch protein n=1 Tax=Eshraghiella crossota TaxID=45851 RepID=UPI003FEF9634